MTAVIITSIICTTLVILKAMDILQKNKKD